ncbi:MAG: carbon-nitrogen hydrolase family protein [Candidatus Baltobacteraceae bacterium]
MRRTISVASLQMNAHDRDAFELVWPHILQRIQLAGASGAQLVVLPEGTVPAYVIGNAAIDSSVTERALNDICGVAQREKIVVVYGTVRFNESLMYNSASVVDSDGSVAGHADKCFLWHFDRQWFASGDVNAPIKTSLGNLGVMICADGRIPTIARSLADQGADLFVMPTAWVTSGRDPENLENIQADLLARVRARENGLPFLAANKSGVERGCVLYCGKSQIIDASGEILAIAAQQGEETLTSLVQTGAEKPKRAHLANPVRASIDGEPKRFAISDRPEALQPGLLQILEADFFLNAQPHSDRPVHAAVPAATANDTMVLDPAGLVPYKLAGYELIVWRSEGIGATWLQTYARARALELRLYIVCILPGEIAFAVDPDGMVLAATFGDFRVASFAFVPDRTRQTAVAPGTDIMEGLERVRF